MVYISPDPPVGPSFVKLWEEGEYSKGQWFANGKLVQQRGIHSIKIPAGLKAGVSSFS